ncbi:MAG: phosphatidylserine/phosphatidylglycerophosphate/cardiolipin synthase-like enzyme [Candidatus Woesearchaeota archaeon]|jgi:phosphatidylserine/phosphatidylglycerophosphate/cardiolipin synthase-like enzyme
MKRLLVVIFLFLLTGCSVLIPQETGNIQLSFCPESNCETILLTTLESATDYVDCAFFDLNVESFYDYFVNADIPVRLVIDNENDDYEDDFITYDTTSQLTHNKFCIIDGKTVVSGSMNPTVTGTTKNNNNLIVLNSSLLAINYQLEFEELYNREFGKGMPNILTKINLSGILIENYFCPEDNCEDHVIQKIDAAQESIIFMTFAFTSKPIVSHLALAKLRGVTVEGLLEPRQRSQYSVHIELDAADIPFTWSDNYGGVMHHKVFIIDSQIVITGSYNPTKSGNTRNDENILIIHDKDIATQFLEEYNSIR